MKRIQKLTHRFIEFVPDELEEGVLYISIPFATTTHRCCCGCGEEVVTPLTPTDWSLIFDGETVSFTPSIGNWSFACRSHYWIRRNQVVWAPEWSESQIALGRLNDLVSKQRLYGNTIEQESQSPSDSGSSPNMPMGLWANLKKWFCSK
jgi:hypothetical protein